MTEIIGAAVLFAVCSVLLKSFSWRGAPVFCALCTVFLLSNAVGGLADVFSSLKELSFGLGVDEAVSASLKILGMGYLFGMASDAVSELGEPGISKALLFFGRVEIIAVILPYFKEVLDVGVELLR